VYELFMAEMIRRIVRAKAPKSAAWALGRGFTPLTPYCFLALRRYGHLVRLFLTRPENWFHASWEEEMEQALEAVVKNLRTRYGKNFAKWAWGRIRPLVIPHDLGRKKPLARVFNLGPFACGGDTTTVNQAAVDLTAPMNNPLVTASLRMVLDIGNWDKNSFVLPGGQSGNPLSCHYADLMPLWQAGGGITVAWSEEMIARRVRDTLELIPSGSC
jgi:penicillin amidase